MNYRLLIRPDALVDIEVSAEWYNDQEAGLGEDFTHIVLEAIDSLRTNPLIHRLRDPRRKVRWLLTHRFPYRIVYQLRGDVIIVFAVIHAARHEREWKGRVLNR